MATSAPDPRIRVCAVCARMLDYVVDADAWQHTLGALVDGEGDHPAVPASPTEIFVVGFCDFCYAPDPPLEIPARDFEFPGPRLPGQIDASSGAWGACRECARLVDTNQWTALARRTQAGHLRRYGEPMVPLAVTLTRKAHRALRSHITGPSRPSTVPTPADPHPGGTG